ncbi:MAG TPA: endolytic transglycosylase MltG [Baekduia sp.]|nr:endolytic transglycosylase MltG [Baekduia sp.]
MTPRFGGGRREDDARRERTAADREAARLERERRRAAREGRPLPEAPAEPPEPAAEAPLDPEPPVPAEPPVPVEPPPPVEPSVPTPDPATPEFDEPPAPVEEPVAWQPVEEPEPVAYEPDPVAYAPEPVAYAPEPVADEPEPEPVTARQPVTVPPSPGEEAPAGVRRRRAPSVRDLPEVAAPQPAQRPRQRGLPRQRRGTRRVLPLLLLVVLVAIGYGVYRYAQPFHGEGSGTVRVTIPSGASAGDVADLLAERGVVDSATLFNLHARLSGKRGDIKAGAFTLRHDMSYADALDAITRNPAAAPTLHVTIPEGLSIREAAPIVKQAGLRGSYVAAASRSPRSVKALKGLNVPKGTKTLEGFLFPASYELERHATARQLVAEQVAQFRKELASVDLKAAKRKNLTSYDVLIIASMIEREAQVPKDRRLISAVIYNRLKQGMPLGIDATLRYHLHNWSRPLRQSELESDSPFNTRTRQGLPPTPIGSPGFASLQAAADPANVDYLFYVVKPCGNGAHAFSSTDAQFEQDVAAYNRKRDELGGKDPSHC